MSGRHPMYLRHSRDRAKEITYAAANKPGTEKFTWVRFMPDVHKNAAPFKGELKRLGYQFKEDQTNDGNPAFQVFYDPIEDEMEALKSLIKKYKGGSTLQSRT